MSSITADLRSTCALSAGALVAMGFLYVRSCADETTNGAAGAIALVRLPHRTDPARTVELQVDDQKVVVSYGGEPLHLRPRAFALQFVEAVLGGRVDIEVQRGPLWRTTRSYLDGSPRPFLVTRMPVPSLRPGRERRRVGFGAA